MYIHLVKLTISIAKVQIKNKKSSTQIINSFMLHCLLPTRTSCPLFLPDWFVNYKSRIGQVFFSNLMYTIMKWFVVDENSFLPHEKCFFALFLSTKLHCKVYSQSDKYVCISHYACFLWLGLCFNLIK